jgi:hypothetical protein
MSQYWWKEETLPVLETMFLNVQVVGCSNSMKFRGGKGAGDTLIMAIVSSPNPSVLADLPPMDIDSVGVIDILNHRFDSNITRSKEFAHLIRVSNDPTKRERLKPKVSTFNKKGEITEV